MVRSIRIISQIVFFTLFILTLVFLNRNGYVQKFPTEWFLQLNPLVALLASIASRTILFVVLPGAIIVTIVTLFFGRVFCGFVCPLGAAIDFVDAILFKKLRHATRRPPLYFHRIKYVLLICLAGLALAGVLFPLFMDPISISTRLVAILFEPIARSIGLEGKVMTASLFTSNTSESTGYIVATIGGFSALVLLTAIFIGGYWDRRFWCQYVCPSGAFFAIVSRVSFLRRRVIEEKCNYCKTCASHQCPTRAIDATDPKKTSTAECILCGKCAKIARKCTVIGIATPKRNETLGPDIARRNAVMGVVGTALALPVMKTAFFAASGNERIRPPGALPENQFITRCIACGECIKACPNHALQPCSFIDGLSHINTPRLVPRIGACDPTCNACTYVCPTAALRPVPIEDKPYIKIGTALVDTGRCAAWRGERRCISCMRACPYQAITEEDRGTEEVSFSGPSIDKELCTGCGLCEQACPVTMTPAIRVYSYGERRESTGPFISDNRRKKIIRLRKERQEEATEE